MEGSCQAAVWNISYYEVHGSGDAESGVHLAKIVLLDDPGEHLYDLGMAPESVVGQGVHSHRCRSKRWKTGSPQAIHRLDPQLKIEPFSSNSYRDVS